MALDLVTFKQYLSSLVVIPQSSAVAVAVSGGPDSMVLCHILAQLYPKLTALIVDHGLRPESKSEAIQTQNNLNQFNISSEILTWLDHKPTSRIQESARQARYTLLQNWCAENGVLYLFTAHHLDDQWETLYMRHCQSSGSKGMQGIPPLSFRKFGALIRPLLSYSKQGLLDYAQVHHIPYVNDPSNLKPTYERGYIRLNRNVIEQKFPANRIGQIISSATASQNQINKNTCLFIREHLQIHPCGALVLNQLAFIELARQEKHDLIQRICQSTTNYSYPMPKSKIDRLISEIELGKRSTLGGWLFSPRQKTILISREQRYIADLTYITHTSAPPIVLPNYVNIPNANQWIHFHHPLT